MVKLKNWMDKKRVTQAEFAEMLPFNPRTGRPLTQGAISQWFTNGEVPSDWVPAVRQVTRLPMADLNPRFARRVA